MEGLQRLLTRPEFEIVGAVHDGQALVEAAETLKPDVIVADISMPGLSGVEAAIRIREKDKRVRIIFLTMHPEVSYAVQAMRAGAAGYVLKHAAGRELFEAIAVAMEGGTYLPESLREPVPRALKMV
jgi:DNA-binding NarL/FixJ family response regulator